MEGLLYRTATPSEADPSEFVLSDETVDRYGDVIAVDGWDLKQFKNNPIALFNHNSDAIIGRWEKVRIEGKRLVGKLVLAAEGTSQLVDEVRRLWDQKMIRAVSVGFRAIKKEPLDKSKNKDADDPWYMGPTRFLKSELVECSLVAVPANPNALSVSKAFDLSADVRRQLFGKPARETLPSHSPDLPRVPAQSPSGNKKMKLSDKIRAAQTELNRLRDQLTELNNKEDQDDDDLALIDELTEDETGSIAVAQKELERLQRVERALIVQTAGQRQDAIDGEIIDPRRPFAVPKKKVEPRDYLLRVAVCHMLAHVTRKSLEDVVRERYGQDEMTGMVLRAVTNPAMTTVPGWAQELVQVGVADFLNMLMPISIYPRLSVRGARFTFDRFGSIKVPARSSTDRLAGAFIGEGHPIPVRKASLTSVTLTPKKMAVISTFTRELAQHSTPSIEQVIRDAMNEDTAVALDTVLIDDQVATPIRPAGLRYGVTAITGSTAATAAQRMVEDLRNLISAITTQNGGRDIVILLNPQESVAISFMQTSTGDFMFSSTDEAGQRLGVSFISSTTVPPEMVIAVDAVDFASATGDTPEYDVSDQATLHEETVPLPIMGHASGIPPIATPAVASPTRSLWQTASLGVRMLLDVNWAMRRSGMVSWINDADWVGSP